MATGVWHRWFGREKAVPVSTAEGYALWAPRYPPHPHNPLMLTEQAAVAPVLQGIRSERALDLGSGTGRYLPVLSATGARLVVGVDLSLPMLLHGSDRARRVCADSCRLPFADATFDLISASLMVGDVRDIGGWIAEAARVLAPGGHLVYSDFHPSWTSSRWRRTFRSENGREYELPYFSHAISEHLEGLARAGLRVQSVGEPRVAGRSSPVLVVLHATKGAAIARATADARR